MNMPKEIPEFNHERFMARISIDQKSECWNWLGAIGLSGYGNFSMGYGKVIRAHRASYALFKKDISTELVIDHMCRNRKCVNPDHLRQVDNKTNVTENSLSVSAVNIAKEKCSKGHFFTKENTYISKKGRVCRACQRTINNARYSSSARRDRTIREREKKIKDIVGEK